MKKPRALFIVLPYLQQSDPSKTGYWGQKYESRRSPSTKMNSWPALPYGALSVATYSKDVAEIKFVDCNVQDDYLAKITVAMRHFKPDYVALAAQFDTCFPHLGEILATVARENYFVPIVIGGAATMPVYVELLTQFPAIDAVCYSEGEIPFRKLMETKTPWQYLRSDPSWMTRLEAAVAAYQTIVPMKSVVESLDNVIKIDYSFVDVKDYSMRDEFSPLSDPYESQRRFFMVTSRGCPFKCSFCYRSREDDRKMRYASVDKVVAHAEELIRDYGMTVLTLCDDQLLVNMNRAKEIFRRLQPFNLRIECLQGESVAFIDEEMASLMKLAGMTRAVLAIESGSPFILEKMVDKPVDLDKAKEVIKILRSKSFWVTAVFVMGFPGETDYHRQQTLEWIREADLDWSTFSAAVPIKGTRLYDMCIEGGFIKENIGLGEMDFSNYIIGPEPERIAKEIYKMNLRCNFVENFSMRQGYYGIAARAFEHVIRMYPHHAFAWYYLAECQYKLGGADDAAVSHTTACLIFDKDPQWAEYAEELNIGA